MSGDVDVTGDLTGVVSGNLLTGLYGSSADSIRGYFGSRVRGAPGGTDPSPSTPPPVVPTTITMSAADAGTTGSPVTLTWTLDEAADQTYTITPSATGGATLGHATRTITAGQTQATSTVTLAADGSTSVDFTVSPSLTRAGRPKTVTFSDLAGDGDLPANTLVTGTTSATVVTYGQPFKDGAIAPGEALSGRQINPITYWPSGYVKHAIVSSSVSGATSYTDTLAIGSAAAGSDLTTSDLQTAMTQAVTVSTGTLGSASWAGSDWASPFETVATGPLMSSWVYRKQIGSDAHLVAWLEVRLYSTGAVEVFPWIENGYVGVASPTSKTATYTLTIGGTTRFSWAGTIYHHTRLPLIDQDNGYGSAVTFSHWLSTDPQWWVALDGAYVRATKCVPNAFWAAPSSSVLDATQQTYTPNTLADDDNATGGTGGSGAIISGPAARYLNAADVRAWKGMMAHALSAGSWPWHYRDENTNRPVSYASYASYQIGDAQIPAGSGGSVAGSGPAMSHMPSYAYLPFLVTGRTWFLEELQFQATWGFLSVNPSYRNYGDHTIDTTSGFTVRGGAWSLNLAAQAAAATPSSHSLSAQFVASWQRSMARLYGRYVAGTIDSGAWVSPLGVLGSYSGAVGQASPWPPTNASTAWWEAMYQHNYVAAVLGYASDIGIDQDATSYSNHVAARDHSYKLVIGRAEDGNQGRYNWRRFICYAAPIGTDESGLPPETYYSTHGEMYDELRAGYSLADIPSNFGLSLKQHSSDTDLTSGVSSLTYGSTALAALAMAVEHGVAGAAEGYSRVTGASNFESSFEDYLTDDAPNWAVVPRMPEWLPAAGAVVDASTNTLDSVVGSSAQGVWKAWSGVGHAPWWGAYGSIVIMGGGHTDGSANYIFRFDPSTRLITKIKDAAAPLYLKTDRDGLTNMYADPDTGYYFSNGTAGDWSVYDGQLATSHQYGSLLCVPPDAMTDVSAPNGWIYALGITGMPDNLGAGPTGSFRFRLGVGTSEVWSMHGDLNAPLLDGQPCYGVNNAGPSYDPTRNRVWCAAPTYADRGYYRDLSSDSDQTNLTLSYSGSPQGPTPYPVQEYSSRHDCVMRMCQTIGSSPTNWNMIQVWDVATSTFYQPTQTGTPPDTPQGAWAACWSEAWDCFVFITGMTGQNKVWFCKPSGNPRTDSWAWTSQTITSGTMQPGYDTSGDERPSFNRLRHMAELGDVLIWCSRTDRAIQAIGVTPP